MFDRKDSNRPSFGILPGNPEISEGIQKHLKITLLMIDAKFAYENQQMLQELKKLFDPIKESQDAIIKRLLESNVSLTLKENPIKTEEKVFKIS